MNVKNLKKMQLDFLVTQIFLKVCNNVANKTEGPLFIDLFREDIQKHIYIIVLLELRAVLERVSCFDVEDIHLFINVIVDFLLESSVYKIVGLLELGQFFNVKHASSWRKRNFQKVEYSSLCTLLKCAILFRSNKKKSSRDLVPSLMENVIIKSSNIILYDLFSIREVPKFLLKYYVKDHVLFSYNLANLSLHFYWSLFVENIYISVRRIYTYNVPILIFTQSGIKLKKLYSKELLKETVNPKVYLLLLDSLNFIEYLYKGSR